MNFLGITFYCFYFLFVYFACNFVLKIMQKIIHTYLYAAYLVLMQSIQYVLSLYQTELRKLTKVNSVNLADHNNVMDDLGCSNKNDEKIYEDKPIHAINQTLDNNHEDIPIWTTNKIHDTDEITNKIHDTDEILNYISSFQPQKNDLANAHLHSYDIYDAYFKSIAKAKAKQIKQNSNRHVLKECEPLPVPLMWSASGELKHFDSIAEDLYSDDMTNTADELIDKHLNEFYLNNCKHFDNKNTNPAAH